MLAIHYCRQDERTRRYTTERTRIAIGRASGNDLVLIDPTVSEHHCRLTEHDGDWVLDDLGSERGTRINGRLLTAPAVLGEHERIYVGPFVLELEKLDGRVGPLEAGLLEAIERCDEHSRTVYADWLEERGELVRAEFLRIQQSVIDEPMDTPAQKAVFLTRTRRMRELAASIDVEWRRRVARPAVEGCRLAFEIPCKMDWGQLEPTDRPEVRNCNTCRKAVHYCVSEQDAFDLAARGHCVVVDVRQVGIACKKCGSELPRNSSVCLACGQARRPTVPSTVSGSMEIALGMPPAREPYMMAGGLPHRPAQHLLAMQQCESCHATNPSAFRFCSSCGVQLAGPGRPERP